MHEFFMPVLVSVPLVVGYLMVLVGQGATLDADGAPTVNNEAIFGGYSLMWKIATVVILWKGVFMAMDKSIAKETVDNIKDGTEKVGKFAMRAFRYAPIFPVKVDLNDDKKENDRMAIGDLFQAPTVLGEQVNKLQQKSRERARKIG